MNLHTYFQILSRNHVFIDSEAQDFWPGTPIGVQKCRVIPLWLMVPGQQSQVIFFVSWWLL